MFVERRNEFRNVFELMLHQQEADTPHLSIEKAAHRRPFEQEYDFQLEDAGLYRSASCSEIQSICLYPRPAIVCCRTSRTSNFGACQGAFFVSSGRLLLSTKLEPRCEHPYITCVIQLSKIRNVSLWEL